MKPSIATVGALPQLADTELLALSRYWGRVGKMALRRFLATLPEIMRRGLFRRCRCQCLYEYAAKFAGASREVVDDVLLVHRRLGSFEEIWSLFAAGQVGLSVLRQISRHVTADKASWWADLVRTCSMREIDAVIRQTESAQPRLLGSLPRPTMHSLPASCVPTPAAPAIVPMPEDSESSQAARDQPGGLANSPAIGCPAPPAGTERVLDRSVMLTPLAAEILDNFLLDYQRRGQTISKAELLELILKSVALDEALPRIETGSAGKALANPQAVGGAAVDPAPVGPPVVPSVRRRFRWPRVLVELKDIGLTFARTVGGLIPLTAAEAAGCRSGMEPIAYCDLLAKAIDVGQRATGRMPPAIVQLAITIRSAGKCEAGSCCRPIAEFDHLDPYSQNPVHHPERMVGLCNNCHRARHDGLFLNPDAPPESWVVIGPGVPRSSTAVDLQVQRVRQQAGTAGLPSGRPDAVAC